MPKPGYEFSPAFANDHPMIHRAFITWLILYRVLACISGIVGANIAGEIPIHPIIGVILVALSFGSLIVGITAVQSHTEMLKAENAEYDRRAAAKRG
jgi:hypothetical protein